MQRGQTPAHGADPKRRRALSIVGLLLAALFDLALLQPLLVSSSLDSEETLRAYYEPQPTGIAVMLDRQHAGYITDLEADGPYLQIPAGRTIAIPLRRHPEVTLQTLAPDLAPYFILGSEASAGTPADATRFADPLVFASRAESLEAVPWNAGRPWSEDWQWLRELHTQCNLPPQSEASIRMEADEVSIRLGTCAAKIRLPTGSSPLLLVAAGLHASVVSDSNRGWEQTRQVSWKLATLALLRVLLLAFSIGVVPTALCSIALLALGQFGRTTATLTWAATLPIAVAAAAARLAVRIAPRRTAVAWVTATVVLALEIGGIVAAIAFLDVGTFGHERMTLAGDSHCSIVGYSTVRGDSLRRDSDGLVERLDKACAGCRNRTSRFSREAQTLRWVREVACSPSFPAPGGSDVVFLGGGNDDLFYRPTGVLQLLADFAGTLRFVAQPIGATDWEDVFGQANQRVLSTLDDQTADIEAIVRCAEEGGRNFYFVHDFLIWDLDRGRPPARLLTFARRRDALLSAGGHFIDLLEEFQQTAGVAWLNDFIHPSAVGQQMIADLLCERMAED